MSTDNTKEGVKVIRLVDTPGHRFELDEEALQKVLLHPDVKDCPVVLVSVAGAYRGGKSFVLDFFLRFLMAPRASQLNGEWLTTESSKLEGFAWRGGSEPHTSGIHLWPEPFIVTLDNGEKVAVLLMDTQGTFDHESTLDDNSSIFALSVLTSSVQIYNILGNIREDDLQHLQLFTEYGRAVANGKAFQKLLFLVRDWQHPTEYAYGFEGGEAVLANKLKMGKNQANELRYVREHIRSCFESIKCFLMPHPGLDVRLPTFKGTAKEIDPEFCTALLQLVPSLFDPQQLVTKDISGERVKAKHLLEYFKRYVDIFNSNELPAAVTIFKATSDACLAAALRDAQDKYQEQMERNFLGNKSVTPQRVTLWHNDAVHAANDNFDGKRLLGSTEDIDATRAKLAQELSTRLSVYNLQNDAKAAQHFAAAKKVYEDKINSTCGQQSQICLHPSDLESLLSQAISDAKQAFANVRNMDDQEDLDGNRLQKELNETSTILRATNEQNNQTAILNSRSVFEAKMKEQTNNSAVSVEVFEEYYEVALQSAIETFHSARNFRSVATPDAHVDALRQVAQRCYQELKVRNTENNRVGIQNAVHAYQNYMNTEWGPKATCFHPLALEELHTEGQETALEYFRSERIQNGDDRFVRELVESTENRYRELVRINEFNNKQAIENAMGEYTRLMVEQQANQRNEEGGSTIVPVFPGANPLANVLLTSVSFAVGLFGRRRDVSEVRPLSERHQNAKASALRVWQSCRRGEQYDEDPYREMLEKRMNDALRNYD